jgi:hypothetical protein
MDATTETVNGFTFNTGRVDGVGEWDGREEEACAAIDAIHRRIAQLTEEGDDDAFQQACKAAWDRYGDDAALPDFTRAQIDAAARALVGVEG